MKRRIAREKAIQALFQVDRSDIEPEEALEHVLEEEEESDDFLESLVSGTLENREAIDERIKAHLQNWSLDRIGNVDRTILRMGIYEMLYIDEIPMNVTMNEAIELAKIYGDDNSSRFINGVLSKVATSLK
ncbi:transcription antitermination factor NusB [Bacillus marinisedimentorum]|uniref:transcription antitermination factor NusB n=1 Tax=Bacillus marinisedimentorum TaxID=1821260 RepID=UPI000871BB0F|nr:transcription antitermination factor NusB [Bacillus marinisedimentorum]